MSRRTPVPTEAEIEYARQIERGLDEREAQGLPRHSDPAGVAREVARIAVRDLR